MSIDSLSALYPDDIDSLKVAWDKVRIPGPPLAYRLTPEERISTVNAIRFKRRTIQRFNVPSTGNGGQGQLDRLAFIDKVAPHSQFDLMCTEVSESLKATVADIGRETGEVVCRSAYNFVDFVSQPETIEAFGLQGGELHLALNCDPYTLDRESIQASKQFHMHFLYWVHGELEPLMLGTRGTVSATDLLRKHYLDPLLYLGAAMVEERLRQRKFSAAGMQLLPFNAADSIQKALPLGCLVRLDEWAVLNTSGFIEAIETIHDCIETTSQAVLAAFTGCTDPPAIWQRHALLPSQVIVDNIRQLGFSEVIVSKLRHLANVLRDVSGRSMAYLKHHKTARQYHLTLNNPCYALNLYAPHQNQIAQPLIDADEIYLTIQAKLFAAIGGSGLVALKGIPRVRIVRGAGEFNETLWRRRTEFQREFTAYNYAMTKDSFDIEHRVDYRFIDPSVGWRKV